LDVACDNPIIFRHLSLLPTGPSRGGIERDDRNQPSQYQIAEAAIEEEVSQQNTDPVNSHFISHSSSKFWLSRTTSPLRLFYACIMAYRASAIVRRALVPLNLVPKWLSSPELEGAEYAGVQ
jgi:hypothetical protein